MRYYVSFLALVFLLAGCSSGIRVMYDQDSNADFTQYHTYQMLPWNEQNNQMVNDINKLRLLAALKKEFALRGIEEVKSGGDIAVSINVVITEKTATTAYTDYYSMGGYGYYPSFGYGTSQTRYETYAYLEGTLILDVFDVSTKSLVWQGIGVGTVEQKESANREKGIQKAMAAVMLKYPVRATEIK